MIRLTVAAISASLSSASLCGGEQRLSVPQRALCKLPIQSLYANNT